MLVEINAEGAAPPLRALCCHLKRSQPSHSEICRGMTVAAERAHCGERQCSTLPLQIPCIKGKAEKHCCSRWPSLHAFFKALYSNAERLLRYLTKTFFMLLLHYGSLVSLCVPQPVSPFYNKGWAGEIYCGWKTKKRKDKYQVCLFMNMEFMHFFIDMTYYFPSSSTTRDLRAVDGGKQHALMCERNPASTVPQ